MSACFGFSENVVLHCSSRLQLVAETRLNSFLFHVVRGLFLCTFEFTPQNRSYYYLKAIFSTRDCIRKRFLSVWNKNWFHFHPWMDENHCRYWCPAANSFSSDMAIIPILVAQYTIWVERQKLDYVGSFGLLGSFCDRRFNLMDDYVTKVEWEGRKYGL